MTHTLAKRMTHRYRAAWSGMDDWRTIGTYDPVAGGALKRAPRDDDEYDDDGDGRTDVHIVSVTRATKRVTDKDVRQALRDEFTYSHCTHEYDCCGCRSFHAYDVHKLAFGDKWVVVVNSSCNF